MLESKNITVKEPYVLNCDVSGSEPMAIEWLKDGVSIDLADTRSKLMQVFIFSICDIMRFNKSMLLHEI